jgi:hypothetical protein
MSVITPALINTTAFLLPSGVITLSLFMAMSGMIKNKQSLPNTPGPSHGMMAVVHSRERTINSKHFSIFNTACFLLSCF